MTSVEFIGLGEITYYALVIYVILIAGVLLACQQKLKRGKKQHKKKKKQEVTDVNEVITPENKGDEETHDSNGIRKRTRNSYRVSDNQETKKMGLFQSKPSNDEPENAISPAQVGDKEELRENDTAISNSHEKYVANDIKSQVVSQTSAENKFDSINSESNYEIVVTNDIDDLCSERNYKSSSGKVDEAVVISNQSDNSKLAAMPLEPKPGVYIESVEYVTVEEKVICEEYDDGTKVIKTIITEIPNAVENEKDNNKEPAEVQQDKLSGYAAEVSSDIISGALDDDKILSAKEMNNHDNNLRIEEPIMRERTMSDFKLFIFNKYAEKLLKNLMNSSYKDSIAEIKFRSMTAHYADYANSVVDNLVTDITDESAKLGKKNSIENCEVKNHSNKIDVNHVDKIEYDGEHCPTVNTSNSFSIKMGQTVELRIQPKAVQEISPEISAIQMDVTSETTVSGAPYQELNNESTSKTVELDQKPIQNGLLDEKPNSNEMSNSIKLAPVVIQNGLNKEISLTVTDGGDVSLNVDSNQNIVKRRPNNGRGTDRPLSGFAEKLAELLAEEDDNLDFFESDEELSESLEKVKSKFGPKRRISVEVSNFQQQFSVDEINTYGNSNDFKSKCTVNRRKNNKFKGDRPMSLYAQDMLADILNDEEDEEMLSDESDNDNESNYSEEEDDVLEDEILPVKETAVLLENAIPFAPIKRNFSITSEYEIALDEVTKGWRLNSVSSQSSGKPPPLQRAVVIDAGCGILKAGLCGDTEPSCYCPSVIGVPRRFSQDVSKMKKPYYVGDEAWSMAGMLQIEHPIKQDISNWPDVTNIFEHLLEYELKVNDSEHPVLLTEMGLTSSKNREKVTEVMFEKFGIPAFYLSNQESLALYSMGMTTGLCLNSGFYNTQAVPVYEGNSIPYGTVQLDIGGDHVTNYLGRLLLGNQGMNFSTSSEKLVLNSIKQTLCYLAEDASIEKEKYKQDLDLHQAYTLPDGQEIELGSERCVAPEILFDPQLLGLNQPNTAECIKQSIERMNPELAPLMSQNILITGGNSKLTGFADRLESELQSLYAGTQHYMNINYADNPILAPWIGGSILSSISVFRDQWITLDSYAEQGAQIVHRVCF